MEKAIFFIIIAATAVALLITGGILLFRKVSGKSLKNATLILPDVFTYTAHTGCVGTKDNSLQAIEAGAKHGADIIEFDLNFLPDGTPVLSHDKPKGKEITLEDAFKKVCEYESLLVNIDIKSVVNLKAVYPLAEKYGLTDRIFYTGVNANFLEAVKNDSPRVSYYLNCNVAKPSKQTDEYLKKIVKEVKESGAIGINFNKANATKKLVEAFRENGLLVSIWTVNKEKDMYKIILLSPDNITTRNPDILQKLLNKAP